MQLRSALAVALLLLVPEIAPATSLEWVTVGDPGNACDTGWGECVGAVDATYRIGKYEVTNAQYAEFLNAVAAADPNELYSPSAAFEIERTGGTGTFGYSAALGRENRPAVFVSYYDALRFANWLHNGKPTGAQDASTTEDGAYTFTSATTVGARNAGARVFLPNEDEWYKAAYYDALSMSYHTYPFADGLEDAICSGAPPGSTTHSANCLFRAGERTDVGAYFTSPSEYGTFDQGGNVREWLEPAGLLRGGDWTESLDQLRADDDGRTGSTPTNENNILGFRLAAIPEPGTGLLTLSGLLLLARRRREATLPLERLAAGGCRGLRSKS